MDRRRRSHHARTRYPKILTFPRRALLPSLPVASTGPGALPRSDAPGPAQKNFSKALALIGLVSFISDNVNVDRTLTNRSRAVFLPAPESSLACARFDLSPLPPTPNLPFSDAFASILAQLFSLTRWATFRAAPLPLFARLALFGRSSRLRGDSVAAFPSIASIHLDGGAPYTVEEGCAP